MRSIANARIGVVQDSPLDRIGRVPTGKLVPRLRRTVGQPQRAQRTQERELGQGMVFSRKVVAAVGSTACCSLSSLRSLRLYCSAEDHSFTSTTQIWFASSRGDGSRRTKAIRLPSGENTHASGRGADTSSVREVRRLVGPEATSVTQMLLSITCAICPPFGLQVNAEAIGHGLLVICRKDPPQGETVQNCTTPASSFIRKAISEPSGELRSQ